MERCVLLLTALTVVSALDCRDEPLTKNLTGQLLSVIPSNTDGPCVAKLLLGRNQIALNETDRLALESYPALTELRLEENQLTQVPAGFFAVVPNLTTLSLARNDIKGLDSEAFSGLDLLTDLDLAHNRLTSLPEQIHGKLKSLQLLNLEGNSWNCSCRLLSPIRELNSANVSIGGNVKCSSPPDQAERDVLEAEAQCSSSPEPTTSGTSQPPSSPNATPNATQNHNTTDGQKPGLGNSWKFTASIVVLALVTSALIVCAVKGPSWYKLFHNYRHRRLNPDDDGNFTTTVFKTRGRYRTADAFGFQNPNVPAGEERDDDYFEDPYIGSDGNEGD